MSLVTRPNDPSQPPGYEPSPAGLPWTLMLPTDAARDEVKRLLPSVTRVVSFTDIILADDEALDEACFEQSVAVLLPRRATPRERTDASEVLHAAARLKAYDLRLATITAWERGQPFQPHRGWASLVRSWPGFRPPNRYRCGTRP